MNQSYTEQEKNGLNHHRSSYRLPFAAMAMLLSSISPVFAAHHIVTDASVQNADGSNQLAQQESQVSGENEDREDAVSVNNNTYETLISNQNQFGVITIESRNAPLGKNPNYIIDVSDNNINEINDLPTFFKTMRSQRNTQIQEIAQTSNMQSRSTFFAHPQNYITVNSNKVAEFRTSVLTFGLRASGGKNSIAVGTNANAEDNGIAIGDRASAKIVDWDILNHSSGIVIGSRAEGMDHAIVIGLEAHVKKSTIGIGPNVNGRHVEKSILIGQVASSEGEHLVAIGYNSRGDSSSVAIGYRAFAKTKNAVVIGRGAQADSMQSIAIGFEAKVRQRNNDNSGGIAIGSQAIAIDTGVAIGSKANAASGTTSVAIGSLSVADRERGQRSYIPHSHYFNENSGVPDDMRETFISGRDAVSFGDVSKQITRQITNVSAGIKATDAINVRQLKILKDKILQDFSASEEIKKRIVSLNDAEDAAATVVAQNSTTIGNLQEHMQKSEGDFDRLKVAIDKNTQDIADLKDKKPEEAAAFVKDATIRINKITQTLNEITPKVDQAARESTNLKNTIGSLINKEIEKALEGIVAYDRNGNGLKQDTITLKGGNASQPVLIENLANGQINENSSEMINGGQLYESLQTAISNANTYTDEKIKEQLNTDSLEINQAIVEKAVTYALEQKISKFKVNLKEVNENFDKINNQIANFDNKFAGLNQKIEVIQNETKKAAAVGLAVANLRYNDTPGKLVITSSSGLWRSQNAFAIGAGFTSSNGKMRSSLSTASSGNHWGAGAGVAFTLN